MSAFCSSVNANLGPDDCFLVPVTAAAAAAVLSLVCFLNCDACRREITYFIHDHYLHRTLLYTVCHMFTLPYSSDFFPSM
jgi:hypothetical protein